MQTPYQCYFQNDAISELMNMIPQRKSILWINDQLENDLYCDECTFTLHCIVLMWIADANGQRIFNGKITYSTLRKD